MKNIGLQLMKTRAYWIRCRCGIEILSRRIFIKRKSSVYIVVCGTQWSDFPLSVSTACFAFWIIKLIIFGNAIGNSLPHASLTFVIKIGYWVWYVTICSSHWAFSFCCCSNSSLQLVVLTFTYTLTHLFVFCGIG